MEIDDNWEFENLMRERTKICYFVSTVFVYCGEAIMEYFGVGKLASWYNPRRQKVVDLTF